MQLIFTDGLGNEMFQYAMYLALRHRGRKVSINIGIITRNIVHNGFELCDVFNIERGELPIVWNGKFAGGVTIFINRHLHSLCYHQDVEKYSDDVFCTKKPFIVGYWQDVRYFKEVEEQVREAFAFRNIDETNLAMAEEMKQCNSVSLHIRRGDYLKYPNYQVCTPEYYEKAISVIKEKIENPVFYIFSDDLTWSEDFVKSYGLDYQIVGHNRGKDSYKDMYLMTQCKHNIIANSSFSWWGAWLGEKKDRVVVCPERWLRNHTMNPCLDGWIKVRIKL